MTSIVFDMDGTLCDFYGVENWLVDLQQENTRPYDIAQPFFDMEVLNRAIQEFRQQGIKIIITSWLSKNCSADFANRIRTAKKEWLTAHNFHYDEIHLVKYGTCKANCSRKNGKTQILIDDDLKVRNGWRLGATLNPRDYNDTESFIKAVTDLIEKEV